VQIEGVGGDVGKRVHTELYQLAGAQHFHRKLRARQALTDHRVQHAEFREGGQDAPVIGGVAWSGRRGGLAFQDGDVEAVLGQAKRGHQPDRPGADDDNGLLAHYRAPIRAVSLRRSTGTFRPGKHRSGAPGQYGVVSARTSANVAVSRPVGQPGGRPALSQPRPCPRSRSDRLASSTIGLASSTARPPVKPCLLPRSGPAFGLSRPLERHGFSERNPAMCRL